MLLDTKDLQAKLKISRNRNYVLMRVSTFLTTIHGKEDADYV